MSSDHISHAGNGAGSAATEHSGQHLWTIVPAAGVGRRMGGFIPKQYLRWQGLTILELTINRLFQCPGVEHIFVVLHCDDHFGRRLLATYEDRITVVAGGRQRVESVCNGLLAIKSLASQDDWVMVHDAARPCVRPTDVSKLSDAVKQHPVGGLLGAPVADTLKRVDHLGAVEATVSRDSLWRAYTPQIFRFGLLYSAIDEARRVGRTITDESSAIELAGYAPLLVEGHPDNIKVTRPEDMSLASLFLNNQQNDPAQQ